MKKIAVIGTAGRDKTKPLNLYHWEWMLAVARRKIIKGSHLVSGGAAWADHIAVQLFLEGHASALDLHLPAPINEEGWFVSNGFKSAGGAANYYHSQFSLAIGRNTIKDIVTVSKMDACNGTVQPISNNYSGLFKRNALVANSDGMVAFTMGQGDSPDDGGTLNTWNQCKGEKVHVSIPIIL